MNKREVNEIRRVFRKESTSITRICGCYVNSNGELQSNFITQISQLQDDEWENILAVLKKTLSGQLGKHLVNLTFSTDQVASGEEHKLLSKLRDTELKEENAVEQFFSTIIPSITLDHDYIILLAYDAYDIPFKRADDTVDADNSDEVFRHIVCCVCPVKLGKSGLSFHTRESELHNLKVELAVSNPEFGFLYPTFDDRSTNLYGALFYSKNASDNHADFVKAVFGETPPISAGEKRERFQSVMTNTLTDDCTVEVLQYIHNTFDDMLTEYKESRCKDPLLINAEQINKVLETCGISDEKIQLFDAELDQQFGPNAEFDPNILIDTAKFVIRMPDVTIQVKNDRCNLLKTRVIDGVKYVMVRAEGGLEIDGVEVHI